MALTKAQRARLEKLATYLEGLPRRYRHFDMAKYVQRFGEKSAVVEYARKNGGVGKYGCGAVACAVGHGPAAGILVPASMIQPALFTSGLIVEWDDYAGLFTGRDWLKWHWLFSADWETVDNHHYGAAGRIRLLLARGAVPREFEAPPRRKHRKLYAPYRIDAKTPA